MSRFDDRLTKELERAARPAEPAGVFDEIDRRRERRVTVRRIQTAMLAVVVFAGSIGGVLVLNRAFRGDGDRRSVDPASRLPHHAEDQRAARVRGPGARSSRWRRTVETRRRSRACRTAHGAPRGRPTARGSPSRSSRKERSIWVLNAGRERRASRSRRPTTCPRPSWSPDGTRSRTQRTRPRGPPIHIVNAGRERRSHRGACTLTGRRLLLTVSFSPGRTKLLYDAGTDAGFGIFVVSNNDGTDHAADYLEWSRRSRVRRPRILGLAAFVVTRRRNGSAFEPVLQSERVLCLRHTGPMGCRSPSHRNRRRSFVGGRTADSEAVGNLHRLHRDPAGVGLPDPVLTGATPGGSTLPVEWLPWA